MNRNFIFYLILSLLNILLNQSEKNIEKVNQNTIQPKIQENYTKNSEINSRSEIGDILKFYLHYI